MITANRLFRVPALSAFLMLIPIFGFFLWLFIVLWWYNNNQEDIHSYFRGQNYHKEEYTDTNLEDMK